jgi:hypothetical protein
MKRRCIWCGKRFRPRRENHRYCSEPGCQRVRKNRWQRVKIREDADYRENQRAAQKVWRLKHPDYSRAYRSRHPAYVESNRLRQSTRRRKLCGFSGSVNDAVAKMDATTKQPPVLSGRYKLVPIGVAKMDAITVHLSILEGVAFR